MIEVINVTKRFDMFTALDQVNMHVKKGAIYGLVGPNGAGKSTIIRHITGAYRQDAGEIRVNGQIVYENAAVKAEIAYIPDDIFYYNQANMKDMVRFYKDMYPSFDKELFERLQECFPSISLKRAIRRLSKGMQKQAAFWLAICCRPKLLILDEPVDGLDPVMRRQIWSLLMSDVAEHGTTVLVSSHNLRELEDVCDHVGIMHHGKVIMEKSLDDLQGSVSKIQVAFDGERFGRNGYITSVTRRKSAYADYTWRTGCDTRTDCFFGADFIRYSSADTGGNFYIRVGRRRV